MRPIGVLAGLLAVTLLGVGGTMAYLRATATVSGATIQAGDLQLRINGSTAVAHGDFAIAPNAPFAQAFTIGSVGHAPANASAAVNVTSTQALRTYTHLRLVEVANAAACTTALTGGVTGALMSFPATSTVTHLAAGETQWLCAIVRLEGPVPVARAGETVNFTLTFTATQAVS